MEKIAVIADMHGNLTAFLAVMEDIKKRGIKRIFCLGDIIGLGSDQNKVLDIVKYVLKISS